MRTTLLGSLLDAAARNLARGADARRAVRVRRASTCAATAPIGGGPLAGDFPGERPAPVAEPHRLGALAVGPLVAESGAARRRRPTSSPSRACSRRSPAQLGAELELRAGGGAVPPPGPRGARSRRRATRAGWIGEIHPLVCRGGTSRRRSAFEIDAGGAARRVAARRGGATRTSPPSPPSTRTWRWSCREDVRPREVRAAVLAGGGELLRSAEVFDLYEGEQVGEGTQEPGAAARVPRRRTAPSPTRRSPALRAAIEAELERDRRDASWLSVAQPLDGEPAARVLVAGASGFTGALAAQIVWRHPRLELVAATSRSDAGKRLDELYPRYRVPIELTELDLDDRSRGSTRRSSPTRTAPRRRPSPRCAAAACSSSTSPPTSACATWPPTSAGTASTARPELLDERASTG